MANKIERGRFKVEVNPQFMSVNGMKFSPGEADKIARLVSLMGRMADLEALPPTIGDPPFRIVFDENGDHFLTRTDHPTKVTLSFDEADTLVQCVMDAVQIFSNLLEFGPKASRANPAVNYPDIIDGRN